MAVYNEVIPLSEISQQAMKVFVAQFILLFYLISSQFNLHSQEIVLFGTHENDYKSIALELAFSKLSDKNYVVKNFSGEFPKIRAFERMRLKEGIDVIFGGTTVDREAEFLPVRFPMLRGLNGWRIALRHKDNTNIFANISTVEQLSALRAGLYHDWSDTMVMESNDIPVIKASNYSALYSMLHKKRFDYFPRSVIEIDNDYQQFKHLDISIDKTLLIHYPTAYYFFVAKDNQALAADIELGLSRAYADGSLTKLFMQFYGDIIKKYTLKDAVIIRMDNQFLPEATPLNRSEFWIDLEYNAN